MINFTSLLIPIATLLSACVVSTHAQTVLISQYTESGSTKGIELWNVSGSEITFDSTSNKLEVFRGSNGSTNLTSQATVDTGTLATGAVLVIGTGDMGPDIVDDIGFNGNDALVVEFGGVIQDIFGLVGDDPGSAWESNGVSTADQNIQLQVGINTGDTDGWTDPSERFEFVAVGTDTLGFGFPPGVTPSIPTNVSFAASSDSVAEDAGTYNVTIFKSVDSGNVSGQVELGGTAVEGAGSDYTIDTTNFTMNGSTTSATLVVTINDDPDSEGAETLALTLANVTGADTVSPSVFTLTIEASDGLTPSGGIIWINEFAYDQPSSDTNEFIEIAGPAGHDLSKYSLVLYNGNNGESYDTLNLSGTIDDEGCGFGAVEFEATGIQNGAPDGMALVSNGVEVLYFLSYEGAFTASDGPAAGFVSTEVVDSGAVVESFPLFGTGSTYDDFAWETNNLVTRGTLNPNQTIDPCGGGTVIDPYDITGFVIVTNTVSVTAAGASNGIPYTLYYTTNLLTDPPPFGTGIADADDATTLDDTSPEDNLRLYWMRSNDELPP